MRRLSFLVVLVPVVVATAIAGLITNPANIRPCAVEYSSGIRGAPLHIALGADGNLYTGESANSRILQFNPNTHKTREFFVPPGNLQMHDLISGPDGNIWFDALNGVFGKLDLTTGTVTTWPLPHGTQPHDLIWFGGKLYMALLLPGELAIWDPSTGQLRTVSAGLPPNNEMHSLALVPGGYIWVSLSNANEIARYNPALGRFDKFVTMPIPLSGPRDMAYLARDNTLYFTLFAANKIVGYNVVTGKLTVYNSFIKAITLKKATALTPAEKLTFLRTDATGRYLYSGTFDAELIRFNPDTGRMKRIFCGISFPSATAGITHDRQGRLWFVEAFPGRLVRLEP